MFDLNNEKITVECDCCRSHAVTFRTQSMTVEEKEGMDVIAVVAHLIPPIVMMVMMVHHIFWKAKNLSWNRCSF